MVEDNGMRLIHVLDPGHAPDFIPFPLIQGCVFQCVFSRVEPVLIQNLEQSQNCKSSGWNGYKDGSILAFPLSDETGNIIAVLSLHSKRKPPFIEQDKEIGTILASYSCKAMRAALAISALMKSEERFKTVINDMPVMLCRFKPDGAITFVNNYFCRYFETKEHEALGMRFMDFIPGEERESALSIHAGIISDDSVVVYEQSMRKSDGEIHWQRWIERAIFDENKTIQAYQSLGQDITREKKLEEDLRQAQKMESIGRLAGGISHDFNNLLSPILGYADMLIINLAKDDPQHEFLTQIQKAADRAKTLTRQLLAFSRKQVLDMKSVCPDEIVTEFEKILRRTIREDIVVTINLTCPYDRILADVSQIEQILMNLAVNAQDAMPEGGRLTIETAIEFTELADIDPLAGMVHTNCVRLSVQDTGAGMDPYTLSHAFDPFYTTKAKDKGTGLGLSTVHGIVRQHGGVIRTISETGKGTTFNLFFPIAEADQAAVLKALEDNKDLEGHETILVVEDNDMVRDVVCQILERYGYEVMETGSPNTVFQMIEDHDGLIDLLLTDVVMPEINGKQLYEKVKALLPDIRVLFMSGYADSVLVHHELTQKKWPFIQKPVGVQELVAKVREILDNEKPPRGKD